MIQTKQKQAVDEVLLVAFGGPTPGCCKRFDPCPGEAHCFVSGIFGHNPARKKRIEEVAEHYRELGGFSRFNEFTSRQAAALTAELERRGRALNVRCGYHHWAPYVRDVIAEMKGAGVGSFLTLVMAPHQSSVSWDLYLRIVGEGVELAGDGAPRFVGVVDPWWNERGFIVAIAERIREAARRAGVDAAAPDVGVMLTAHAVPVPVAQTSPYTSQITETATLVMRELGVADVMGAYQSSPDDARIEWTKPSLETAIGELAAKGKKHVLAAPIGFLCDNVEVLYDLGIEGERIAARHGLTFTRAEAVHDHPAFIAALADRIERKLAAL